MTSSTSPWYAPDTTGYAARHEGSSHTVGTAGTTGTGEPSSSAGTSTSCGVLARIWTASTHCRRGLRNIATRALLAITHEHDVDTGLPVASGRGVEKREPLGWTLLADVHILGVPGARNRCPPSHAQVDEELG